MSGHSIARGDTRPRKSSDLKRAGLRTRSILPVRFAGGKGYRRPGFGMRRWVLKVLAAFSLLLCAAVCVLWVRSARRSDYVSVALKWRHFVFMSFPGGVKFSSWPKPAAGRGQVRQLRVRGSQCRGGVDVEAGGIVVEAGVWLSGASVQQPGEGGCRGV